MKSTAILTTTIGVFLEIEEFNELRRAEPYKRLIEAGWVDLILVCYDDSVRVTVSDKTTVGQIAEAAKALMKVPVFGSKVVMVRTHSGILLEHVRSLKELAPIYGEKLYIG